MAAVEIPQVNFEDSFTAVVSYISQALNKNEFIRLPDHLIKPFRSALYPKDPAIVKPLLRLFDGAKQHNAFKLAAASFGRLIAIIFHAPHSLAQERLLYNFVACLKDYNNQEAVAQAYKKCGLTLDVAQLQEAFEDVCSRLTHGMVVRLVGTNIQPEIQWLTVQFLAVLLRAPSRNRLTTYPEFAHLKTLLASSDNPVLRFLLADCARELCAHGAAVETFLAQDTATQIKLSFPTSKTCDAAWLLAVKDVFSDLDAAASFTGSRHAVVTYTQATLSNDSTDGFGNGGIAIVTDRIVLLSAAGNGLELVWLPIPATNMLQTESYTGQEASLILKYFNDSGCYVRHGVKHAISEVTLDLASNDDTTVLLDAITDAQTIFSKAIPKTGQQNEHRSIAFLNLWSDESRRTSPALPESNDEHQEDTSPLLRHSQQERDTATVPSKQHLGSDLRSENDTLRLKSNQGTFLQKLEAVRNADDGLATAPSATANEVVEGPRLTLRSGRDAVPALLTSEGARSSQLPPKQQHRNAVAASNTQNQSPQTDSKGRKRAGSGFETSSLAVQAVKQGKSINPRTPLAARSANAGTVKQRNQAEPAAEPAKCAKTKSMARLAGPQPSPDEDSRDSQKPHSLKRGKPSAAKTAANKGDEARSTKLEADFELSDDSDEDERPAKKAKTHPRRKPAGKKVPPAPKKSKPSKQTIPKATSKVASRHAARLQEDVQPTAASTRSKRSAAKTQSYEEPSGSDSASEPSTAKKETCHQVPEEDRIRVPRSPRLLGGNMHDEPAVDSNAQPDEAVAEDSYPAARRTPAAHDGDLSLEPIMAAAVTTGEAPAPDGNTAQDSGNVAQAAALGLDNFQGNPRKDPQTPLRTRRTSIGDTVAFVDSVNSAKRATETDAKVGSEKQDLTKTPSTGQNGNTSNHGTVPANTPSLPSDRAAQKTPIIRFSSNGPVNQGVPHRTRPSLAPKLCTNAKTISLDDEAIDDDSVLPSEATEEHGSTYEQSEEEEADGHPEDQEFPIPAADVSISVEEDLADEDDARVPPPRAPDLQKEIERRSIGLNELMQNRYPDADTTIFANRTGLDDQYKLQVPKPSEKAATAPMPQPSISTSTVADMAVPSSQELMPPPRRPVKSCLQASDRSSLEVTLPVNDEPSRVSARRSLPKADPVRLPPDHISPYISAEPRAMLSTPAPFHQILEQKLSRQQAASEDVGKSMMQRHSYATEDGADTTMVNTRASEDEARNALEDADTSSGASSPIGCNKQRWHDVEDDRRRNAEVGVFEQLKRGICDTFLQTFENSLQRLEQEHAVVINQVETYQEAGRKALEEAKALWTQKINHESRKRSEEFAASKASMSEALSKVDLGKNWEKVFRPGTTDETKYATVGRDIESLSKELGL